MSRRNLPIVLVLAVVVAACATDPQAAKQKFVASGDEYAAAGKLAEASIQYLNAIQQDPNAGDVRVKLAEVYLNAGDFGRALQEYARAADLLPDDSSVQLKAGGLLLMAAQFDDARLRAEKVIEKDAKNVDALILLANAFAGLNDFDSAVAQIEEAIQVNPARGATYSNLGSLELSRGKRDAAEAAFKKAIEIDGQSAEARLALANFYWVDAKWALAEQELKTVVSLQPDDPLARRALANFYISTNRAPEAEPHLKKVAEVTKAPTALMALADYYVASNDDAAARGVLEPLAAGADTAALVQPRLATLDHKSGQREAAYRRLDQTLAADKANLTALLVKANLLAADRRLDDALASAALAVQQHPDSAAAQFAVGRIQMGRKQLEPAIEAFDTVLRLNPRATDAKVMLAQLHLAAGRPDTSVGLAREAIASDPESPDARLATARALIAKKDVVRAKAELDQLLDRFPDSAAVHLNMGLLQGLRNDQPLARKHFERALEIDPKMTDALGGLVMLDLAAKRVPEALARVEARVAQNPSDPAALLLAARTYGMSGNGAKAEEYLKRLIQTNPDDLTPYAMLAQLYVSMGRLDAALAEYESIAKRDPKPVGALTFAGIILQGQGKTADAQDRFERALKLDADAAVAANNLAWIYAQSDDRLDTAMDLAETAKRGLPDSAEVSDTLGYVYYRKGMVDLALPAFQQSLAKDPSNPTYLYHLALAQAKAGNNQQARESLSRALRSKSDFADAREARALLESLPQ
jgi:putative PEP-CTERM system TPR-repeat lipoprotein